MRKLIKFLFSLVLFLVILVVAGVGAAMYFIDPNDYKPEIAALVEKHTGRTLRLDGDITLSFYPWLGLNLGSLGLSNAPGFGDQEMVSAKSVGVKLKLLPLFEKRVELDTLYLDGMALHAARNAAGHFNWDDIIARTAGGEKTASATEADPSHSAAAPFAALQFGGLEITQAQIFWQDATNGQDIALRDLNLKSGQFEPGQAMPFSSDLLFSDGSSGLSGRFAVQGKLLTDVELQTVTLQGLALELDAQGAAIPEQEIKLRLTTDLKAEPALQRVQLAGLNIGVEGKAIPGGSLQLQAETVLDLQAQTLSLDGLTIQALGLQGKGHLHGKTLLSDPLFNWAMQWGEFNPRELLALLGQAAPETTDSQVLQVASLALKGQASATSLKVEELKLRLDDSHLDGHLAIKNFAQPEVYYRLALDHIALDRYLPPSQEGKQARPVAAEAGAVKAQQLPVEMLRALKIDGDLKIGKLTVRNLLVEQAGVGVTANGGKIALTPRIKKLYGGSYRGKVVLDVRNKQARIHSKKDLVGVQIGPLLRDVAGEERLSGTAELHLDLHSVGLDEQTLRKNLRGKMNFRFEEGAVHGFNLAEILRTTKARFTGQPATAATGPTKTDFSEMTASFKINKGVAHNDDFLAKSPFFRVTGKGDIDLGREKLDYLVKAVLVSTPAGQGGKELSDLQGVPIPIRLKGSFQDPSYSIDLKEAITASQKEKLKGKAEKALLKKLKLDKGRKGKGSPEQELIRKGLDSLFR